KQAFIYTCLTLPVLAAGWWSGLVSVAGRVGMTLLAAFFIWRAWQIFIRFDKTSARELMFSSFLYLPAALLLLWCAMAYQKSYDVNTMIESGTIPPRARRGIHPPLFALWAAMAGIIMMFGAMTSAYIVRQAAGNWLEFTIPDVFYTSTIVILVSSLTLHGSYAAFRASR